MFWIPWLVGWALLAPSPPVCRVRVVGVPLPQLRHHKLRLAGRVVPAARVVDLPEGPSEVLLLGPRYSGSASLPERCDETVVLHAAPRPAQLEFFGLPARAVLTCEGCPGIEPDANYLPAHFPPMVTSGLRTAVRLRIRAPGFHSLELSVVVYPGDNVVRVTVKPR